MNRRRFLQDGSLWLLGSGLAATPLANLLAADEPPRRVRIGLVTDLHYADKPPAGTRHYRETLAKFEEATAQFQEAQPDFVVELGDLIDAADSVEAEKKYLATINREFAALPGDKHYVLGNHCVATLTKEEFLDGVGQKKSHYSFDAGGFHFVMLDACFRGDGEPYNRGNFKWTDANIPEEQVEWLRADLKATTSKTIVFAHQRLDVKNEYGVKNSDQVRQVLEESGKALAVFQGHSHKNDLKDINGIHYCTLVAMVEGSGTENNGFSLMDIFEGGTIRLTGFRKQSTYDWKK
jgi:3',5'-cyclic AMP phosphodiesterase CpdA